MKIFLCALMFTSLSIAETPKAPDIKSQMKNFYANTTKLQNYIQNKSDFMNEKNSKTILEELTTFREQTENLKKNKNFQSDEMKFLSKQLSEDLTEAETSFKNGFKDYSYWILKSSMNSCFTCHTQKSLSNTEYRGAVDSKDNGFSSAEFLFIVRNYPEALKIYEQIVLGFPKNKATVEQLEASLRKILFYSMRVLKNEEETLKLFDKLSKNKDLPESVNNDLSAWKNYLTIKKYRLLTEPNLNNKKNLDSFIDERSKIADRYNYPSQRYIVDLETSHFLYQLLEKNKNTDLKPWILYYSALVEKDYRVSMFDMTVDRYLRECIEIYSQNPASKKCLNLYKEIKTLEFTGSRGTDIPKDVQKQFKKYEKMVNKK